MRAVSKWLRFTLQSKLLILVVSIVILLLSLTMWIVNNRFTDQFHRQGRQSLETAQAVFKNSREIQIKYFQAQFQNAVETPRVISQVNTQDPNTIHDLCETLTSELNCELIFYSDSNQGDIITWASRSDSGPIDAFRSHVRESVFDALSESPSVQTVTVGGRLFNLGSAPVTLPNNGELLGLLTFAEIIGESSAQELKQLTRTEIVIVADNQVIVSTLSLLGYDRELVQLFDSETDLPRGSDPKSILIEEEHYLALTGHFDSTHLDPTFGYLLLNSYEQPLHDLRSTQGRLFLVSLAGMLISLCTVWITVRKITQPLRDLREGVEAVGRDDFSHRIEVQSRDEFGDLAVRFNQMIQNLQTSRENLDEANKRLIEASRQAGMAEVATGVLHNVGNVLNSINVSTTVLSNGIAASRISHLKSASRLLEEHKAHLGAFLEQDQQGKQVPDFLSKLAGYLEEEQGAHLTELDQLRKNLDHIKDIINMQQNYATASGIRDSVDVLALIEDSININFIALQRHGITLVREFDDIPKVQADKHKILQILINLIRNAKYALTECEHHKKRLILRVFHHDEFVRIIVKDNGVGILPENMDKIFRHGFTTKSDGHGFGLHSGAIAAKEMGGSLTVHSDGPNQGAEFTLDIPIRPPDTTPK